MAKERKDYAELDLEAHRKFREYADKDEYEKAFKVFRKRPGLINCMTLAEIPSHYLGIRDLGFKEGLLFRVLVEFEIEQIKKSMDIEIWEIHKGLSGLLKSKDKRK